MKMKYKILIILCAAFLGGCAAPPIVLLSAGATVGVKGVVDDIEQDVKIKKLQSRAEHLEKAMKFYLTTMASERDENLCYLLDAE
jgi:hypothetical protein